MQDQSNVPRAVKFTPISFSFGFRRLPLHPAGLLPGFKIRLALQVDLSLGDPPRSLGAFQLMREPFEDAVVVVHHVLFPPQPVVFPGINEHHEVILFRPPGGVV